MAEMCKKCLGSGLVHPNANTDITCDQCLGKGVLETGSVSVSNPTTATPTAEEQQVEIVTPVAEDKPVENVSPLENGGDAGSETDSAESAPQ